MGAHDFEYNKVALFLHENQGKSILKFAAPKQALVPASRYYCDVTWSYHNVCAKFH